MTADTFTTVPVSLGERSYEVVVATDRLSEVADFVVTRTATRVRLEPRPLAMLVTDGNVAGLHAAAVEASFTAAGFPTDRIVLEAGEHTKSLRCAEQVYDRLVERAADRRTLIAAVGGGVIGDLAGFVAATYARGVPYVQVPTTLLAQVDSSVGGKVAVNHPRGKNLIGCFYQPIGVFCDTATLATLPPREYACGLAEVVKYGVILDAEFFAYLESHVEAIPRRDSEVLRHIVARCCRLKADIVQQDEREETGLRAVLNYGHTFAHAFETLADYHLLHGEAVAIGMICASRLAELRGTIAADVTGRQVALLEALGLPTRLGAVLKDVSAERILAAMQHDKKAVGGVPRFVLPTRLGHVEQVGGVDPDQVRRVLDETLD